MKYQDLILKTKEESDKALAPARAAQEKARLGIQIAELDLQVQSARNELEALKGAFPLDVDAIVSAGDELALQERRLGQLKQIDSELFSS